MRPTLRIALVVVLLGLAIGAVSIAVSTTHRNATASAAEAVAPTWLAGDVAQTLKMFDARTTSVEWSHTDRSHFSTAINDSAPVGDAVAMPVDVVVLRGEFVANLSVPAPYGKPARPREGTVLVFAYDSASGDLTDMVLIRNESCFTASALGSTHSLSVPQQ